jgi:hypothetical protein
VNVSKKRNVAVEKKKTVLHLPPFKTLSPQPHSVRKQGLSSNRLTTPDKLRYCELKHDMGIAKFAAFLSPKHFYF